MTHSPLRRGVAPLLLLAVLLLAALPARAVEVQRVVSPGGIEAWLVEDHTNPLMAMRFAFRGGAALDPEGKEGLANLASGLLDEGAADLDSQTFQGRLEDLSITLRFDAGRDIFAGQLRTLTENRAAALDLLKLALTEPRFDAEPVDRIRSQILANIRRESRDPDVLARRALFEALFPDHPYGRPVDGTEESVAAITVEDLKGFVARRLARDTLHVGVVGDITAEELGTLLDQVFGGLPETAAPWNVPTVEPTSGETIVITKPAPQSAIVFAQRGVLRDDPDYYVASTLNHILGGGGFTSRLYEEVRERRGLAYSVYSSLLPLDAAGLVFGGAGTANARAAETVEVVRREWARMAAAGPTEQELADAKLYLTGSFPLRFSSSDRVARILVAMQLEDLGIDYLDRRNGLIEAVTLEDVRRVAGDLLDPEALTVVVAGEPDGITATN